MADIISESAGAPDLGEIEQGNNVATADAILSLHRRLEDIRLVITQLEIRIAPEVWGDWIRVIGGLY